MALSATTLSTLIKSELTASGFDVGNSHAQVALLADAIAKAVVAHITSAAVITTPHGAGSIS